jgi:hypothetical protein
MALASKFTAYTYTVRQVQQARQGSIRPGMTLNAYGFMGGVSQIRNPEAEAQTKAQHVVRIEAA